MIVLLIFILFFFPRLYCCTQTTEQHKGKSPLCFPRILFEKDIDYFSKVNSWRLSIHKDINIWYLKRELEHQICCYTAHLTWHSKESIVWLKLKDFKTNILALFPTFMKRPLSTEISSLVNLLMLGLIWLGFYPQLKFLLHKWSL